MLQQYNTFEMTTHRLCKRGPTVSVIDVFTIHTVKLLINVPAFIRTRASETPTYIRDRRLFETRRL